MEGDILGSSILLIQYKPVFLVYISPGMVWDGLSFSKGAIPNLFISLSPVCWTPNASLSWLTYIFCWSIFSSKSLRKESYFFFFLESACLKISLFCFQTYLMVCWVWDSRLETIFIQNFEGILFSNGIFEKTGDTLFSDCLLPVICFCCLFKINIFLNIKVFRIFIISLMIQSFMTPIFLFPSLPSSLFFPKFLFVILL